MHENALTFVRLHFAVEYQTICVWAKLNYLETHWKYHVCIEISYRLVIEKRSKLGVAEIGQRL